ncbi:MAG: EamA/RhaT family transporter, partial [Mesorhizobium sp.]
MTAGPGSPPATAGNDAGGHNTLTGIMFKIVSVAVFVGMQTCIKAAGTVPAGQ